MPGLAAETTPSAHIESSRKPETGGLFTSLFSESLDSLTPADENLQEASSDNGEDGPVVIAVPVPVPEKTLSLPFTLDFNLAPEPGAAAQSGASLPANLLDRESEVDQSGSAQMDVAVKDESEGPTAFSARLLPLHPVKQNPTAGDPANTLPNRSLNAQFAPAYKIATEPVAANSSESKSADSGQQESHSGGSERDTQPQAAAAASFVLPESNSQAMPAIRPHAPADSPSLAVTGPSADLPLEPAEASQPARAINIRLAEHGSGAAHLRFFDRAGEVLVSVKSADAVLTQSLRTDLQDLAQRLESSGFRADISLPAALSMSLDQHSSTPDSHAQQPDGFDRRDSQTGDGRSRQHRRHDDDLAKWAEHWNQS